MVVGEDGPVEVAAGAVVDQVAGGGRDGSSGVVGAAAAIAGPALPALLWGTQPICMGPHAPAQLLPERTPGSRTRPWSDSTLPTAASTGHGTR